MKRFLLFGFDMYYPSGGTHDLAGDFATKDEALAKTPVFGWGYSNSDSVHYYQHWQILDTETGEVTAGRAPEDDDG